MSDDFSQLEELIESDMIEALNGKDDNDKDNEDVVKFEPEEKIVEVKPITPIPQSTTSAINTTMDSVDLASLLSQLLNNKTIEITIKVRD